MKTLLLTTGLLFLATAAHAGDIQVKDAWSRPTPASAGAAAVYMTVTDNGAYKDVLQSAKAAIADQASMHLSVEQGGMMKMTPLPSVDIHPDEPTVFKPMGMHIMLTGLHQPLKAGDQFPLTLHFKNAGDVATVVNVTMTAPDAGGDMGGMDMNHMDMH